MAVKVLFAVYGALTNGNPDSTKAEDVTDDLQLMLDKTRSKKITINNDNLGGDPASGAQKHFGALVDVHGDTRAFACLEGQSIAFS